MSMDTDYKVYSNDDSEFKYVHPYYKYCTESELPFDEDIQRNFQF